MDEMTDGTGKRLAMAHETLAQVLRETQGAPPVSAPNSFHVVGMVGGAGLAGSHVVMAVSAALGYPMDASLAADIVTLIAMGGAWLVNRNYMRKLTQ